MAKAIINEPSHTLQEYLIEPGITPAGLTAERVSLRTPLSRHQPGEAPHFMLNIPLVSAIMQAVTGPETAIALAREGGLGFIFGSQPVDDQAEMVRRVKEARSGFVRSKANLPPTATLERAIELMNDTGYSTIPVTNDGKPNGKLLGIITRSDFWMGRDDTAKPVSDYMTPVDELVLGTTEMSHDQALALMQGRRRKNIPIVTPERGLLRWIVFKRDFESQFLFPNQLLDHEGRLRVGAGFSTHSDHIERATALLDAGVDALCFDSSDGATEYQRIAAQNIRTLIEDHYAKTGKRVILGGGNVVNALGFQYLAESGLDFLKVGIGGGSICITREQKALGKGQATAILDVVEARDRFLREQGAYIPIISDGGIVYDPQITVALALGADAAMMGRYFARFDEAPGRLLRNGPVMMKEYWGEGSHRARNWQRYADEGGAGLKFAEGVDGTVPYAGRLADGVRETLAKVASLFVNVGVTNMQELHDQAVLRLVSQSTLVEGSAHDVNVKTDWAGYAKGNWGG